MREFFKPWRSKISCGTLMMALACIAGWAMSYGRDDSQVSGNHWLPVFFDRGDLCWLTFTDDPLGRPEFRLASAAPYLFRIAPAWLIVMMLALLSAYLFLTVPRPSTRKQVMKPDSDDGAASRGIFSGGGDGNSDA